MIDHGCAIADGMIIGENEAQDKARFHRTDKGVTLVTKEMLKRLKPDATAAQS